MRPVSLATIDDVLDRASTRLSGAPPGPDDPTANPRGDHVLDGVPAPSRPYRLAAVLVPIVTRPHGLAVIFTVRGAHLRDHSGQVAFPGGKVDPGDPSPADTALREANEEIGLDAGDARILGYLDPYLSGSGFLVVPVVGLVSETATLVPNPAEVAEVFEVPLTHLMNPGGHRLDSGQWQGRARSYYAITYGERLIWGVTAGIVRNLYERLCL